MKHKVAPVLLFVVGAVVLRLVAFGNYLDYVKPAQGPLLVAAGVLLVGAGLAGIVHDLRPPPVPAPPGTVLHTHGPLRADPAEIERVRQERGHDHSRTPGIAWLWVLPVFLVLLVPPPALGAFAASRAGATVPEVRRDYLPLPPGPVSLQVHDYAERAAWDGGRTLAGHAVTLTGFATPKDGGGWYLTRIVITCCAADSRSYLVEVDGAARTPVANSWWQVTGTYAAGPAATARITAASAVAATPPSDTYELP